jgi:hypothetical protein
MSGFGQQDSHILLAGLVQRVIHGHTISRASFIVSGAAVGCWSGFGNEVPNIGSPLFDCSFVASS